VKHIDLTLLFKPHYTERSALVAAEYVETSKTLQTLDLGYGRYQHSHEVFDKISIVLRALSRNTSVTKLIITTDVVRFASVAFQDLLTSTQTLQKMEIICAGNEGFDEVQTATVTSGFANNTTLRGIEVKSWKEADLTPVLTALQSHPALHKIFFANTLDSNLSLSGLEVLLRSQDSKVKELVLEQVDTRTVGFQPVLRELERNTIVTSLAIRYSKLSRENVRQVKSMLRQNTALQCLDLTSSGLESTGLEEIASVLYRNTSIKTLDLSYNGLGGIETANVLRELLRRNKTITSLSIARCVFGESVAAVRSFADGVLCNTTLQKLDLSVCHLGDEGISFLANALAIRNTSILELDLGWNGITSVGVRALVDGNVDVVKTLTSFASRVMALKVKGRQFWPML
jgi:hypothetical protein